LKNVDSILYEVAHRFLSLEPSSLPSWWPSLTKDM